MTPDDLADLVHADEPRIHPDGVRVAFVRRKPDLELDRERTSIWLHDGQGARAFTAGAADRNPRWSPDGRWLAFLRADVDEPGPAQLFVMPADGGEARSVTDFPLGAANPVWRPDSTGLVVIGRRYIDELADLDDSERARRPRRITRLPFRSDTQGWIHERHVELFDLDLGATGQRDGEPRLLAAGLHDRGAPGISLDGEWVTFVARPDDATPNDPGVVAYRVHRRGGTLEVVAPAGMWAALHQERDGTVLLTGLPDAASWPACRGVWRREVDGTLTELTAGLDRDVVPGAPACDPVGPRRTPDGLVLAAEGRLRTGLIRLDDAVVARAHGGSDPADGGSDPADGTSDIAGDPSAIAGVTELLDGPRCVTGFDVTPDGTRLVASITDPATPGELIELVDGDERVLTAFGDEVRGTLDLAPTEVHLVERDGVELDVLVTTPAGFADAADRSVPVVFMIHGGPTSQYARSFFDEFQVVAGAGALVLGANPRGSSGRGDDWARAVVGAWTQPDSVDTLDLEAIVDGVCAQLPQADPDRVMVMGGSYGGYAVARLLARTDRYGAAIVERGLLDWRSFSGTSDIGPWFDRAFLGVSVDDDPTVHDAASPLADAAEVTTPTLVIHSDQDWRCPPEQGEQYFAALQRAGVVSEYLRFPGENHELTRSGAPRHRHERFVAVLDWLDRWLGGDAAPIGPAGPSD
ncbi:MAG: S9 family peptidase [Nitriliruptoraceae bacterium]|nr:S9 family peptidase [Nitriliruptoraceae bacterium]